MSNGSDGIDEALLLEEARTELDRQQRKLHQVTRQAIRSVQFNGLGVTVVIGVGTFVLGRKNEGLLKLVTPLFSLGLLLVAVSVFSAIIVVLLASRKGPELGIPNSENGVLDNGNFVEKRYTRYQQGIEDIRNRYTVARRFMAAALLVGFWASGLIIAEIVRVTQLESPNSTIFILPDNIHEVIILLLWLFAVFVFPVILFRGYKAVPTDVQEEQIDLVRYR